MNNLLASISGSKEMNELTSDQSFIEKMILFEIELCCCLSELRIIPAEIEGEIRQQFLGFKINWAELSDQLIKTATPVIPLVKLMQSHATTETRNYIHWGATSQDVIDTALMMIAKQSTDLILRDLKCLEEALIKLATQHLDTVMIGRSFLQHALPISFGLKCAHWLSAISQSHSLLEKEKDTLFALQLGGAVGTLSFYGNRGEDIANNLAKRLGLSAPLLSWHTERSRVGRIGYGLLEINRALSKVATDVSLMTQTEIDELQEPSSKGEGGSSTMPHKQNPVLSMITLKNFQEAQGAYLSLAVLGIPQHERSIGAWHAEWQSLMSLLRLTHASLEQQLKCIEGLKVNKDQMLTNLEMTNGLVMAESLMLALALKIGKGKAHHFVEELCLKAKDKQQSLLDCAQENDFLAKYFSDTELTRILDYNSYLGNSAQQIKNLISEINAKN